MYSFFFRFILISCCFCTFNGNAQFLSATLGINGLTCSMCSYAVHSELEKLPFVEKTVLDLNTNVAQVTFKKDIKVNMQEVVNAVYKAGFSVGYTHADFNFDQLAISDQYTFNYQGDDYVFLKPNTPLLEGVISLKFLNKKFLRKKSHDFWSPMIKENLKGKTITKEHLIFFVTL